MFYGVKQVPQHLSATLQREADGSPACWERGRLSAARWAFGTRAHSQGATRDPWEMWDGGGRGRVSPLAPPAAERAANSCRLGSCEGIIPGMSSCVKRAGYLCDSGCWGHWWWIPWSYVQLPFPRIPGLTADRVSLFTTPLSAQGDGSRCWRSGAKSLGCLAFAFPNCAFPLPLP